MSTLLYGAITAQQQASYPTGGTSSGDDKAPPAGAPKPAGATKAGGEDPAKETGIGVYVATFAALVPAEVLAANAALLPLMTDESGGVTTITDSGTLSVVFWLSIAFSIGLFVVADRSRARTAAAKTNKKVAGWSRWDAVRALIPAGAYVGWVMLQPSTAFDAVAPEMEEALRVTIAVFGAIALGVIAKALGEKALAEDPPSET